MRGRPWFLSRYRALGATLSGRERAPQAIRVNPLRAEAGEVLEALRGEGVELEPVPYLDHGFWIRSTPFSLGASIEYLLGMFSLQEAASQLPVQVLRPGPDDRLLDMACAPGGKTTQAAAYMENKGVIVGLDRDRRRLYAAENHLERCGVVNAALHHVDALDLPPEPAFTKVLLDAPCSGNYAADPQWFRKRSMADVEANAELQKKLIEKAYQALEQGGVLVYSTCSLEPEEDEAVVSWLLERHPGAETVEVEAPGSPGLSHPLEMELDERVRRCRRIWPGLHGTQGFFIAKVVKHEAS